MQWWVVAAAADGVVALAYLGISAAIFLPLLRAGELFTNRLGTATGAIFYTCAVGHGLHVTHALLPLAGADSPETAGARAVALHDAVWAVVTAVIGVYYWTLRRTYGRLLEGGTLFADLQARQREAVEVNDEIVQNLVATQLARGLGRDAEADAALARALTGAQDLVGRLLADSSQGRAPAAGDFVRHAAPAAGAR